MLQRRLARQTQSAVDDAVRTAVRAAMEEARASGKAPVPTPTAVAGTPASPAPAVVAEAARRPRPHRPDHVAGGPARAARGPRGRARSARTRRWSRRRAARSRSGRWPTSPQRPAAAHRGLRRLLLLDVGLATARITSRWTGTQALTLAVEPVPDARTRWSPTCSSPRSTGSSATTREVRDADTYAALRVDGPRRARGHGARDRRRPGRACSPPTASSTPRSARASSLALLATAQDIRSQAARLVHDGFVSEVGADRLPHLTRYLRAARHRLVKAAENPQRDADLAWQVQDVEAAYDDAVEKGLPVDDVRWQLEELRVSLFAQQLGTPVPGLDHPHQEGARRGATVHASVDCGSTGPSPGRPPRGRRSVTSCAVVTTGSVGRGARRHLLGRRRSSRAGRRRRASRTSGSP